MASKKFHLTPDGPKKCTAVFKSCRYGSHYSSEESAIASDKIIRDKSEHKIKVSKLKSNINNFNPDFFVRSAFDFSRSSKSARLFAEDLSLREAQYGKKPELFNSIGNFRLDNGSYKPVRVQIMRISRVDEKNARYTGAWRIGTSTTLGGHLNYEEVLQEIDLNFDTESSARRGMLQANEAFRNAVVMSGVRDDDIADAEAEKMMESFSTMFNAVETEAQGPVELWDNGQGYFKESDSETIRVTETFEKSAFRPETFKTFLEENKYYESYTPDAEIRITDENENNGTFWALYRLDGEWRVRAKKPDQTVTDTLCKTSAEAHSHVFYSVLRGVDIDNEKESHRKAEFARNLFENVESALEENKDRVERNWAEEKSTIVDRRSEARKIIDSEGHVSDKNTIRKIFDAFLS